MMMQIVTPLVLHISVIKFAAAVLLLLSVLLPTSNGNYISTLDAKAYFKSESSSSSDIEAQKFPRRTLMQALDWRYIGFYMAFCDTDEDCSEVGPHMTCNGQRCECKPDFILVERLKFICYPKAAIFAPCELTEQCTAMNRNTYCNPSNRCTCSLNYYFDGRECAIRGDSHNLKAQEVYKAAVVAAACFIVAIVGIFVACIVRRSFCRREQHNQQSTARNSDVFSISDEIAALRAVDKPPSYEEVLQIERTFYGIPPPEYTVSRNENLPRSPMTFSSVQTNNFDQCRPPTVFPESSTRPSGNAATLTDDFKNATTAYMPQRLQGTQDHTLSSDFISVADVVSPSLNSVYTTTDSRLSSQLLQNVSATPPPRLQQPPFVLTHSLSSSSLPSTPVLRSHQLASPFLLRRELLKQKQQNSVLSPEASSSSSSQAPQGAASCHSLVSDTKKANIEAAYDNPGFLSDSQDLNISV